MQIPVKIVTYRDVFQWVAKYKDKDKERTVFIRLSEQDLKKLGASPGDKIKISNSAGIIMACVELDPKCPQGFAYMPVSKLVNKLLSYEEGKLPNFKQIEATVELVESS